MCQVLSTICTLFPKHNIHNANKCYEFLSLKLIYPQILWPSKTYCSRILHIAKILARVLTNVRSSGLAQQVNQTPATSVATEREGKHV